MEIQQEFDSIKPIKNASKIEALASKASEETASAYMEPGSKVKGVKRGRPAGSKSKKETVEKAVETVQKPEEKKAQEIPSSKIIEPVVQLISKTTASFIGDPSAQMSASEFSDISQAMGLVLDKWMPTISDKYGAELYLGVALSSWGARLYAIKQLQIEEIQKQNQMKQKSMELLTQETVQKQAPLGNTFQVPNENPLSNFKDLEFKV